MKRALVILFQLSLVIVLAVWLTDQPGEARIVWRDHIIETTAAFMATAMIVAAYIVFLLFRIGHYLFTLPQQWRRNRYVRRLEKTEQLMTQGLAAIAAGDASMAGKLAVTARKTMGETTLSLLLRAQAAQLAGDHHAAEHLFQELTHHKDGAIFGLRGLLTEARKQEKWTDVAQLTDRLADLSPHSPWAHFSRFELLVREQDWPQARQTLDLITAHGVMTTEQKRRHRSALLLAESCEQTRQNQHQRAYELAEQAYKTDRDFLPARLSLLTTQMTAGHIRAAQRTAERLWDEGTQHPTIATCIRDTATNPREAVTRIERLCRNSANTAPSHMAMATALIDAHIWGEARRHLLEVIRQHGETRTTYQLLAHVEQHENGYTPAVSSWLNKAIDAPRDLSWHCSQCGEPHADWQATCQRCSSFNSLEWSDNRRQTMALPLSLPKKV